MKNEMVMLHEPTRLVSKKEILTDRHNELLNVITRNEIEIKVLEEVLKGYEENPPEDSNMQVGSQNSLEELLQLVERQRLQLHYVRETLAKELDAEEEKVTN